MFGFGKPTPGVPVGEVQDGLKDGSVVLIDVRDPMEIKMAGKAKGAIEVPEYLWRQNSIYAARYSCRLCSAEACF